MKIISFVLVLLSFATASFSATIDITVNNIKNSNGEIIVVICSGEDEFSEKKPFSYSWMIPAAKESIKSKRELPPGNYAVIVYHDENSNRKLDKSFTGRPKESYGFSNNKYGRFGSKPKFKEALIKLQSKGTATVIIDLK